MKYLYSLIFGIFLLMIAFVSPVSGQVMQSKIDSLWQLYHQHTDETSQIDFLNEISYAYRRLAPDSLLKYANLAIERAEQLNYYEGLAIANKNKGIAYYKLGSEPDTTIYYYQKAIQYAGITEDYHTQAACFNNIALIHIYNLSNSQAIQYLLEGLAIYDEHIKDDSRLKALILGNLGTAYHRQGDNHKGLNYLLQALAIGKHIRDTSIASIFTDELAKAKMKVGKIKEAYQDVKAVLIINQEQGDLESVASSLITLAESECLLHKYEAAQLHAQEAFEMAQINNFPRREIQALEMLGRANAGIGNHSLAIKYTQEALIAAQKAEMNAYEADILFRLSELFEKDGNPKAALHNLQRYHQVYERNRDFENQQIAARLEAKYQSKERQNQINQLQKEKIAQKGRIRWLWFVSVFFLFLLFIGAYTYFLKWRTSKSLNEKNIALEKADQKLKEKNHQLEAYIESNMQLENFAHLASHDLREPMRTIVSFSQLLHKSAAKKLNENELEFLSFIQEGTRRIETLVNGLLTYAKINNTPSSIKAIDLNGIIDQVCQDLNRLIEDKRAYIQVDQIQSQIHCDPARMYQLFQNLISNAIKYGKEGIAPIVKINYRCDEQYHYFSIADNGVGIAPQFFERVFGLFKTLQSKSISDSSGIGLTTCKKIIEQMGGKIWLESEKNIGSTFHFTLPVNPQSAVLQQPGFFERMLETW